MNTAKPLSVAEVFELTPGDEQNATWIESFTAVVAEIKATKTTKTGLPMNICTLRDQTGSATISLTVFGAVKFITGDVIEVRGPGLRRTEYNGLAQVSMSKNSTIHIVGKSVHHEEQEKRAAATEPAVDGTKPHIHPATAGMGIKEALEMVRFYHQDLVPSSVTFWAKVHEYASSVARLSNALEHGNLTPALSSKALPVAKEPPVSSGGRADPPKGPKPTPGPDGSVALREEDFDAAPF